MYTNFAILIDNKILRKMGCSDSKNDIKIEQIPKGEFKSEEKKSKFAQKVQNQSFNAY